MSSGAALGAPLRHLTDQAVQRRYYSAFPWGAFTVNVAGSPLLGFVAAMPAHAGVTAAAGAGFCGTLTTFSTFGYETIRMAEDGDRLAAVLNAAVSIITLGPPTAAWPSPTPSPHGKKSPSRVWPGSESSRR